MTANLEQYASQQAQNVYFGFSGNPIDRCVADNDVVGLNSLGQFDKRQIRAILVNSTYCYRPEIFDYMWENYSFPSEASGDCVANLALYGDAERIKKILQKTNITLDQRIKAFRWAASFNHIKVVSQLIEGEKIPKESLLSFARNAEDCGYSDLKDLFQNAMGTDD